MSLEIAYGVFALAGLWFLFCTGGYSRPRPLLIPWDLYFNARRLHHEYRDVREAAGESCPDPAESRAEAETRRYLRISGALHLGGAALLLASFPLAGKGAAALLASAFLLAEAAYPLEKLRQQEKARSAPPRPVDDRPELEARVRKLEDEVRTLRILQGDPLTEPVRRPSSDPGSGAPPGDTTLGEHLRKKGAAR